MRSRRAPSPCTRQCAFSASLVRPCCSVSSAVSSKSSMSSGERRKACGSRLYPLSPPCLTSLHKPEGSMKKLPSSPRGRYRRRPGGRGTPAPPPLRLPAGRFAQRGRRRFPAEDMYTGKAHATREAPMRDQDDQPDAREGQAGRIGVAERPVVPMKPGNAGGGKGPQFKTDARRGEGPGDWVT